MLTPQDKTRLKELRNKGTQVSEVEKKEMEDLTKRDNPQEATDPKESVR